MIKVSRVSQIWHIKCVGIFVHGLLMGAFQGSWVQLGLLVRGLFLPGIPFTATLCNSCHMLLSVFVYLLGLNVIQIYQLAKQG